MKYLGFSCLKFLHRQNPYLTPPLCGLLCNALIQPLFDYACTAWFSNLSKRLKLHLQESQNKCMRFCLQLDKRSKIYVKEFLQLDRLTNRYLQFIVSNIFKFHNNQCPDYFDELFCPIGKNSVIMHSSNKKLKVPFEKTKLGIQSLSYVGPNTGNNLPGNLKSPTRVSFLSIILSNISLKN